MQYLDRNFVSFFCRLHPQRRRQCGSQNARPCRTHSCHQSSRHGYIWSNCTPPLVRHNGAGCHRRAPFVHSDINTATPSTSLTSSTIFTHLSPALETNGGDVQLVARAALMPRVNHVLIFFKIFFFAKHNFNYFTEKRSSKKFFFIKIS